LPAPLFLFPPQGALCDQFERRPENYVFERSATSFSALKTMLSGQQGPIFTVLGELEKYALQPVKQAAAAKATGKLSLRSSASWKTTNGIGFSLTPTANCSISIGTTSEIFPVAMSIESK